MVPNITGASRLNKPSYSRQLRTNVTFNIWELIANPTGKPSTAFVFNNNSEWFFFLLKKTPHFLILKKRPVSLTKYHPHGTTIEQIVSTTFICCFGWWNELSFLPTPLKSFQHKYREINYCPPASLLYFSKGKNRPNRKSLKICQTDHG